MGLREILDSAGDLRLWWTGVGVSVAALGVVLWGRVRQVEVPRVAVPEYPVALCVAADVPRRPLERAVGAWVAAGHDLQIVQPCEVGAVTVAIDPALVELLVPSTDDGYAHGVTELHHLGGRVERASVVVGSDDALVLAHEIGHALGYLHARWAPTGHLMAPSHERLGWDTRGLEVAR